MHFLLPLGFAHCLLAFCNQPPFLSRLGGGGGAGLPVHPAPGSQSRSIMASRGVPQARARSNQSPGWGEFARKKSPFYGSAARVSVTPTGAGRQ
jgi:hypothetical protein